MHVDDCVEALLLLWERGEAGEAYNIAAGNHSANIEVARMVLDLLDKPYDLIRFVQDRQAHDESFYIDGWKLRALGWAPRHGLSQAIEQTVRWYADNRWWWEKVKAGAFRRYYTDHYAARLENARQYAG